MSFSHGPLAIHGSRKRGQTLVIFGLMSIVLFGFAGLALDAGHIYLMYRLTQNATDSAGLAGRKRLVAALRSVQPSGLCDPIVLAVHDYAQANGYNTALATGCSRTSAGTPRLGLSHVSARRGGAGACV